MYACGFGCWFLITDVLWDTLEAGTRKNKWRLLPASTVCSTINIRGVFCQPVIFDILPLRCLIRFPRSKSISKAQLKKNKHLLTSPKCLLQRRKRLNQRSLLDEVEGIFQLAHLVLPCSASQQAKAKEQHSVISRRSWRRKYLANRRIEPSRSKANSHPLQFARRCSAR